MTAKQKAALAFAMTKLTTHYVNDQTHQFITRRDKYGNVLLFVEPVGERTNTWELLVSKTGDIIVYFCPTECHHYANRTVHGMTFAGNLANHI